MPGKPTIDDIARLAGVSKATVSRVLNHKPDVDPTTRERILRIVEEQNFVPSITASGLAGGRSRLIGVLVASFTWPLAPNLLRGVAETIAQTPYELVLYSISNEVAFGKERSVVIDRILATKLTSGLLAIFPGVSAHPYLTKLYKQGFPVVMIDDQEAPVGLPSVGADNYQGAYEAVRYLVQLGHRRIAHIQGPIKQFCSQERYRAYCQALQEGGIPLDPALILEGEHKVVGGHACARQLFSLPEEERPTAIFAGNDQMAYGVLSAAEEYGLHVPNDISLMGFDDGPPSAHVRPALTTIRQPFYEMGRRGIELLLSLVNPSHSSATSGNGWNAHASFVPMTEISNDGSTHIQLATDFVLRASCSSPREIAISTSELHL